MSSRFLGATFESFANSFERRAPALRNLASEGLGFFLSALGVDAKITSAARSDQLGQLLR